jgi:hypothetical protein
MASDDKNGSGVLKRIIEPLIIAAVVGLTVMYGTVRIIQTQLESVISTLQETRQLVKEDVRDMGEIKSWRAAMETKLDYMQRQIERFPLAKKDDFDYKGWEKRKP